jgi:hypothetical protein
MRDTIALAAVQDLLEISDDRFNHFAKIIVYNA